VIPDQSPFGLLAKNLRDYIVHMRHLFTTIGT
jgi:hypothetical protein